MRKKVLVFNGYYIPAKKYGGPTTSLAAIVENCSDDYEFYIVAANHDLNDDKVFDNIHDGWNQVGKAQVLYIDLNEINYKPKKIRELLKEVKPDLVWLVGILVPADKWFVAPECRKLGIPYLISPRGEVCENTFHLKYRKKKIVADAAKLLGVYKNAWYHATSEEERDGLVKYYGAPRDRIFLVPNIASNLHAKERKIEKKPGELRVVFISRIQEKKNLLTAIKAVNQLAGEVVFDIYGPMEEPEYWNKCEEEIKKASHNVKISYCGALPPELVGLTFAKYHCFLFPTISENYGHVIVEALSNCCPVVLSKGTTPWDDIDGVAGFVSDLHSISSYVERLTILSKMDSVEYDLFCKRTAEYYEDKIGADNAVEGHLSMLRKVIGRW